MVNSVDLVLPLFDKYAEQGVKDVQLFGGIGSAALVQPGTEVNQISSEIIVPEVISLPQRRENGTLRDVDVFVLSADQGRVAARESVGTNIMGDELDLSFFGLRTVPELMSQKDTPVRSAAKRFLADRYVADDVFSDMAFKAVYPFAVRFDLATLITWQMEYQGHSIPVPHPGTVVMNYLTRSISGLRAKDASKVGAIADNVIRQSPEIKDWIVDGPGRSLLHFARLLHTLREPKRSPEPLEVGEHLTIEPVGQDEVLLAAQTMTDGLSESEIRLLVAASRMKARLLHKGESLESVVALFQKHVERRINGIVKNN